MVLWWFYKNSPSQDSPSLPLSTRCILNQKPLRTVVNCVLSIQISPECRTGFCADKDVTHADGRHEGEGQEKGLASVSSECGRLCCSQNWLPQWTPGRKIPHQELSRGLEVRGKYRYKRRRSRSDKNVVTVVV